VKRKEARTQRRKVDSAPGEGITLRAGRWVVLLCVLASLRPCVLHAQPDPLAIVRRAGSVYRGLSSLQADFTQVVEDAQLGDTLKSTGRLYQAGPNSFAMRFTDPPDEAIVIDGRYVWVYTPSSTPGQVIRMQMESDPVYGANLLARILDRPADRYRVAYLRLDTASGRPVDVVSLVPRGTNLNFSKAILWLDQDDALPRRIELFESQGARRILGLSHLRTNAPVPEETFAFVVPKGVRIVDQ
jgi:outer membrane lipoprotein carrier protein